MAEQGTTTDRAAGTMTEPQGQRQSKGVMTEQEQRLTEPQGR